MHIILMLAFSDFLVSIAGTWGFPPAGTNLCAAQGFLITFFLRANWGWTTLIAFKLYTFAFTGKIFIEYKYMHLTVWGFALLAAFLPLSTGRYGREFSQQDSFCFVDKDVNEWYLFWNVVDWILYLATCIAMIIIFFVRIYYKYKQDGGFQSNVFAVLSALYVYPFVLLVTWVPNVVFVNVVAEASSISDGNRSIVLGLSQIIGMSNGFFLAVVFFMKSPEGRRRWEVLFCRNLRSTIDEDEIGKLERSLSNIIVSVDSSNTDSSNNILVHSSVLPAGRESGFDF
jgi:hypothetical protein